MLRKVREGDMPVLWRGFLVRRSILLLVALFAGSLGALPLAAANRPPRDGDEREPLPDPNKPKVSGTVPLINQVSQIIVAYHEGYKPWADYMLARALTYPPAVEKFLEWPFPCDVYTIHGEKEVYDGVGHRMGGLNKGSYIELEYGSNPVDKLPLLFHEIGHSWFAFLGVDEELEWLTEGIVSFLPIALIDGGFLTGRKGDRAIFWNGYIRDLLPGDPPLEKDLRKKGVPAEINYFYGKAFKIQKLLYKELGNKKYLALVKEVFNASRIEGLEGFYELLSRQQEADWKSLLQGWVTPGPYKKYKVTDF